MGLIQFIMTLNAESVPAVPEPPADETNVLYDDDSELFYDDSDNVEYEIL